MSLHPFPEDMVYREIKIAPQVDEKKWIRAASNFIALTPICLLRQMLAYVLESKGLD